MISCTQGRKLVWRETEVQSDGWESAEQTFESLKEYYPDLNKADLLAKIYFQVLHHKGTPTVEYNEYIQQDR